MSETQKRAYEIAAVLPLWSGETPAERLYARAFKIEDTSPWAASWLRTLAASIGGAE